jgi:hypothetical protein
MSNTGEGSDKWNRSPVIYFLMSGWNNLESKYRWKRVN